jgi:hypothetical protein
MKSFLVTLVVFLLAVYACLAQDSTALTHGAVLSKIPMWPLWVTLIVYEFFARVVATKSNYSIITAAYRIFKFIVPNRATTEKTIVKKVHD